MANIALIEPNSYPCFTRQLPFLIFLYTLVDVLIWDNVFLVFVNIKWSLSASGNVPLTPLAFDSDLLAASRLPQVSMVFVVRFLSGITTSTPFSYRCTIECEP